MSTFTLHSEYQPAGDQPNAIESLTRGVEKGLKHQTLLGVTGSGKTFTMANVIKNMGKPTLVIAHNKTLAAQLAQEYREFFPDNAVSYFVSYYDYYQPEAYVPTSDTYIEKEAQINDEIDRLRHSATQALLTREDVIVVASVSCIYALGSPEEYKKVHLPIVVGDRANRANVIRALVAIYFLRTNADLNPGEFRARGNQLEIMPINERVIYRVTFESDTITSITVIDAITRAIVRNEASIFLFPAKHYVTPEDERKRAMEDIKLELTERLEELESMGKVLEYERLKRRTNHDLALIREIGYCNGIENYSRHFDGRASGEPPYSLLDYFPHKKDGTPDYLTIIDESHVTVPQLGGMYAGDRSRKQTLIEHGFRLPSAIDNRPLKFSEIEERLGQVLFTSATPGPYEFEHSCPSMCRVALNDSSKNTLLEEKKPTPTSVMQGFDIDCCRENGALAEQIIRPTGLVDPEITVKPIVERDGYPGQIKDFIEETNKTVTAGYRVLATTLTKKMAEDLSEYLQGKGIKTKYIHSDIKTIERIEILTQFRKGEFDVLVGVNLLREGLDLPEVALVGILDADKEGFLRSETSLIQTMGRAARNVDGRVLLYADHMTGSMERALAESRRRRDIQLAHNATHGITPQSVTRAIHDITDKIQSRHEKAVNLLLDIDGARFDEHPETVLAEKTAQMNEAVKVLDFETAAIVRDEIRTLQERLAQRAKAVRKSRKPNRKDIE